MSANARKSGAKGMQGFAIRFSTLGVDSAPSIVARPPAWSVPFRYPARMTTHVEPSQITKETKMDQFTNPSAVAPFRGGYMLLVGMGGSPYNGLKFQYGELPGPGKPPTFADFDF